MRYFRRGRVCFGLQPTQIPICVVCVLLWAGTAMWYRHRRRLPESDKQLFRDKVADDRIDVPQLRHTLGPGRQEAPAGSEFAFEEDELAKYLVQPSTFVNLDWQTLSNHVVLTYANTRHYKSALDAIARVQEKLPQTRIVFYDLGLTAHEAGQIQTLKSVTYRKFSADRYPPHVAHLPNYAFKPLVVKETLAEFGGALVIDASVRLNTDDVSPILDKISQTDGLVLMSGTGHSIFAATHPDMYSYFSTNVTKLQGVECLEGGLFMAFNTRQTYRTILRWYYLCALTPGCIAPPKAALYCSFAGERYTRYAGCHRFDQSLINLLTATHFQYDIERYLYSNHDRRVGAITRGRSGQYNPKTADGKYLNVSAMD